MRDYDYENYGVSLSAPKYDRTKEAMPSRDELIARNSFGGPDQNKYITTAAHRSKMAAQRWPLNVNAKKLSLRRFRRSGVWNE